MTRNSVVQAASAGRRSRALGSLLILCVFSAVEARTEGDIRTTAAGIREEALRLNGDKEGRPLPLACHWNAGYHALWFRSKWKDPDNKSQDLTLGFMPDNQLKLIEQGHFLLPTFGMPSPDLEDTPMAREAFAWYYEKALKRCRELKLPIVLIAGQWESYLSKDPYLKLPADKNPNVVAPDGKVLPKVCPFGPVEPWKEVGRLWTASRQMKQIQEWYPDPPLVIFLSNNEHPKLVWHEAEQSRRYLEKHGKGKDDAFKRKAFCDGWIERYRALQQAMRDGLAAADWKTNARFVGYDAFGPPHFGRWDGWGEYSLHTPERISPDPLMWDGGSPSYYTHNWNAATDHTVMSPQVEFMNLVFMQKQAFELNPGFWFEISVWDGHEPDQANDKRKTYAREGQKATPERYQGFVQFGMWLLRPRAVREFRGWVQPWDKDREYYMAIVEAADRAHRVPALREWWRRGELVANSAQKHPYQRMIPKEYEGVARWFLLKADANPDMREWNLATKIPVFSLALKQGEPPLRRWLIYAHAPMGDRKNVALTIPDYREITVDVPVSGSFYQLDEAGGRATAVNDR